MLLSEIQPGSSMTLVIKQAGSVLEFNITALRMEKDNLLVSPIMKDGYMINFVQTSNILYQLILVNPSDRRLYKWSRVVVKAVKDEHGNLYHMIITDVEGQIFNRRQSFRVCIDMNGVARFGPNDKACDIVIKDISARGIGFECERDVECSESMQIHITFEDIPLHTNFKIDCQPVRKVYKEEDDTIFYGCKFENESSAMNSYVQRKQQRIRMVNAQLGTKKNSPRYN